MILKIINNLSKNTINYEVNDEKTSSFFYQFSIQLPAECEDGEYTYELYDNEKMIATGILQIGDYQKDNNINNEYNDNNKDIIVYNG